MTSSRLHFRFHLLNNQYKVTVSPLTEISDGVKDTMTRLSRPRTSKLS